MENKKYVGQFAGREIEGETKQEYVVNALTALYEEKKDLDSIGRMQAYVDYFVNNFAILQLKKVIATSYNLEGNAIVKTFNGSNIEVNYLNGTGGSQQFDIRSANVQAA